EAFADLLDPRCEVTIVRSISEPPLGFGIKRRANRVSRSAAPSNRPAQAAALQVWEVLDIQERKAVPPNKSVDSAAREIAKMLVVDRVELGAVDEILDIRVLDCGDALVGKQDVNPFHKAVQRRR